MGIRDILGALGEAAETFAMQEEKVNELTDKLMRKTYGLERDDVKKIARVLVTQAEVTWKY